MNLVLNLAGILIILGILYGISWNRKGINVKLIGKALIFQIIFAFILIRVPVGIAVVNWFSNLVSAVIACGTEGNNFVFGSLGSSASETGFIFAIHVLGNVIFLSALFGMLYYLGILGWIISAIGKAIGKVLGTTEVESFVAVANMFMGQTDSPVLISKYIGKMTESEIMVILVSGMGSMSVTVLGGYAAMGVPVEHLLIASALVPIGSILISKILLPETEQSQTIAELKLDNKGNNNNVIEAVAEGAMTGAQVSMAMGATLIAFISIVAVFNQGLAFFNLSLQEIFAFVFAPVGFFMGVHGEEIMTIGQLLGTKLVLNEFIAFADLGQIIADMSPRTGIMATICLSGFANFSSMGICVSGISLLCPEKRGVLARLVTKALLGGIAVSLLSALIVGMVF